MKRFFLALLLLVVGLGAVMTVRAARLQPPAPPVTAAAAETPVAVDEQVAADRLAGAVRFATVSFASGAPIDTAAFLGFHDFVRQAFPGVHATLRRETVNGLSLLYTWTGTDSTAPPVVLMGHMDVVPVPESNLAEWEHAPFSGDVADGYSINMHPVAFAAWFGLLATALNLFPISQLDGGHISYAVLGERSTIVTLMMVGVAIFLATLSLSWIVWTGLLLVMIFTLGPRHPPTLYDDEPVGPGRVWLAVLAMLILAVCFTPVPIGEFLGTR